MSPSQTLKCLRNLDSTAKLEEVTDSPCAAKSTAAPMSAAADIHVLETTNNEDVPSMSNDTCNPRATCTIREQPKTGTCTLSLKDSGLPRMMEASWINT